MRPGLLEFIKSRKRRSVCLSKFWEIFLLRSSVNSPKVGYKIIHSEKTSSVIFSLVLEPSKAALTFLTGQKTFRKLFFPSPRFFPFVVFGRARLICPACVTCNFRRGAKRSTRKKDHCPAPSGVVTLSHVRSKNKKRGCRNPVFQNSKFFNRPIDGAFQEISDF